MIRTLKFALLRSPANSRTIGCHATQQNAGYNHGVDVLNREPNLPKRSGRYHPDAMNKRITAWRQADRQIADAHYHIHQEGAEQAWEANQRLQQSRAERLKRIVAAEANDEEPKHRDIHPHRHTLAHRSRKQGRLSLTIAALGKNVKAKRKLNESLAESAIGHVGKLLREEAAKLGIPTVSVPPQGTSQTCPRCGDRRPSNRESQAVFRCRHCGLYAHADWTAAVIIRNRAFVRHCKWQSGFTPGVLAAPTGCDSSHPAPSQNNQDWAWS